jgi:hypothetical protein
MLCEICVGDSNWATMIYIMDVIHKNSLEIKNHVFASFHHSLKIYHDLSEAVH